MRSPIATEVVGVTSGGWQTCPQTSRPSMRAPSSRGVVRFITCMGGTCGQSFTGPRGRERGAFLRLARNATIPFRATPSRRGNCGGGHLLPAFAATHSDPGGVKAGPVLVREAGDRFCALPSTGAGGLAVRCQPARAIFQRKGFNHE